MIIASQIWVTRFHAIIVCLLDLLWCSIWKLVKRTDQLLATQRFYILYAITIAAVMLRFFMSLPLHRNCIYWSTSTGYECNFIILRITTQLQHNCKCIFKTLRNTIYCTKMIFWNTIIQINMISNYYPSRVQIYIIFKCSNTHDIL
jgi:hypothetical protein